MGTKESLAFSAKRRFHFAVIPPIEAYHQIKHDLKKVREAGVTVFGSETHGFKLNPVLSEAKIREFETKHQIILPEDYRIFLLVVGRGGAGPAYGLFNLGEIDHGWGFSKWKEHDHSVGALQTPFPYKAAWNDLSGRPDDALSESDEDEYYRLQEAFERRYYQPVDGAIPICHLGCALRQWLVVSGEEVGNIWNDNTADYEGFAPEQDGRVKRIGFYRWYRRWLDDAVTVLKRSS